LTKIKVKLISGEIYGKTIDYKKAFSRIGHTILDTRLPKGIFMGI
jgi:hypothetical protein